MPKEMRRLAAIVFTDIVGYSAFSERDEALAMRLLDSHNSIIRGARGRHGGREVKTIGDAFLLEFPSALEAVRFALEAQEELKGSASEGRSGEGVSVRIGVHVGDVISRGGDLFGDAVNVASRIVEQAQGGEVCVSGNVYDQVRNKVDVRAEKLPPRKLRGIESQVQLYLLVPGAAQPEAPATYQNGRIAVLPFANISPDLGDGYFADGLTEELISELSGVGGIMVIARTSIERYRGTSKGAGQIGAELSVSHLLEGSVRKAGNRVRVTARLVDTGSQEEVWSERYEKDLDDVFSIQRDMAAQVAEALRSRLAAHGAERRQTKETESVPAYIAYLKGRSLLTEGSDKSIPLAKEQFEAAIRADRNYAKAYAGMADAMIMLGDYLFSPVPTALKQAQKYLTKALSLDPDQAEARVSLGTLLFFQYRFVEAETQLRKAVETNPSYATGRIWYSMCLESFGRQEASVWQALIAEELDPLSSRVTLSVFYRMIHSGRLDEAEKRIRKLRQLDAPSVDEALMVLAFHRKDWEGALLPLRRMIERDPADPYLDADLAYIYAMNGKRAEALQLIEKLKKVPEGQRVKGELIAMVFLALGDIDASLDWLEYAFSKKEAFVSWLRGDPLWGPVKKTKRYRYLLKSVGLPTDQAPKAEFIDNE